MGCWHIFTQLVAFQATVENPVDGTNSSSACLQVEAYNGTVCREAITSLQVCFSGVTAPLNIPSIADQEMGELEAMMLLGGLSFLNPSPQCREAIVPFFCLSIFGLCDADDSFHTILREDCVELRDDICADQWREAMGFLDPGVLPICEELPDISDECVGKEIYSGGVTVQSEARTIHYQVVTSRSSRNYIESDQIKVLKVGPTGSSSHSATEILLCR